MPFGRNHNGQLLKGNTLNPPKLHLAGQFTEKECPQCREVLPKSSFSKSSRARDGLQSWCKSCHRKKHDAWWAKKTPKEQVKFQKRHNAGRRGNPDQQRKNLLRYRFGLSVEQYDWLLAMQHGQCAICKSEKSNGKGHRLQVDHCHESGQIRGLLCHSCNSAIGMFKDDPKLLIAALYYINNPPNLLPIRVDPEVAKRRIG